ncbi:MAG: hypothetical protein LBL54_01835, partial [Clostridiales Family XIII bacterium]|nr:hypothetical protein [Clostridiales Family XIII bacterium]
MRILGRIITVVIAVVVTIVVLAAGYMVYLNVNSKRLPDKAELTVTEVADSGETFEVGEASDSDEASASDEPSESSEPSDPGEDDQADSDILPKLRTEREYRALTYNVGFGAYNHGYSFFMSEGRIAGGGSTKGLMSRADSENSVEKNMEAAIAAMVGQRPDIAIFQEVDKKAGRSYKVDEFKMISRAFGEGILKDDDDVASRNTDGIGENIRDLSDVDDDEDEAVASGGPFAEAYATNFHTGWLLWPPAHPIGMISDSGIATYSRYAVAS